MHVLNKQEIRRKNEAYFTKWWGGGGGGNAGGGQGVCVCLCLILKISI